MKNNNLSLVIPCYQEEEHLKSSYLKVKKELLKNKINYELIFVDDNSLDGTKQIIKEIMKEDKNVKAIFHKENIGRGGTVMDGILQAKYNYVGHLDIDLEVSEKYIINFLQKLQEGLDVALGRRKYLVDIKSLQRFLVSKSCAYIVKFLLNIPYDDTGTGYKFFRRDKIVPIFKQIKNLKWFWDTEIIALSFLNGLKIVEVPVVFKRRKNKKSTVKLIRDSVDYFKNILEFKYRLNKTRKEKSQHSYWQLKADQFNESYNYKKNFIFFVNYFLKSRINKVMRMFSCINLKNKKVLDIGCGGGQYMEVFLKKNSFVTGVDNSRKMIDLSKKYLLNLGYKNYQLFEGDARNIFFNKSTFDVVVAVGLLEYLEDPLSVISKISFLLKPEGYAILSFSKKWSPFFFLRNWIGLYFRQKLLRLPPLITAFDMPKIKKMLSDNNLEIINKSQVMLTEWLILCQKKVN